VPHYPEEDQKLRASNVTTRLGGNVPNTLNVLHQVVAKEDRLVLVSTFAERDSSQRLTDKLEEMGVEVAGVWRDDCPLNPQSWILKSEQTGSRTIVNYNGYNEILKPQNLMSAVRKNLQPMNYSGRSLQ